MDTVGIEKLIHSTDDEIKNIIDDFLIESRTNSYNIIKCTNPELCMIYLNRDTYMCNLLYRYIGIMLLINTNNIWIELDVYMNNYIKNYYNNKKLKRKLNELSEHYKNKPCPQYYKMLEKIITRFNISSTNSKYKDNIKMLENKIFNILNVYPSIKILGKIVHLTEDALKAIVPNINDLQELHNIEQHFIKRTEDTLTDLSKLILWRNKLSTHNKTKTYFDYTGRHHLTCMINKMIAIVDTNINNKLIIELNNIYQTQAVYQSIHKKPMLKLTHIDIFKYIHNRKNTTTYNLQHVLNIIFDIFKTYFGITISIAGTGWNNTPLYNCYDENILVARIFLVLNQSNKNTPIAINIADKMKLNSTNETTISEVAIIGSYDVLTYENVVLLFREFGYILTCICYKSKVGMVNYDQEFVTYMPSVMECFARDRKIMERITQNQIECDQIEYVHSLNIFYKLKLQCIYSKFDQDLHNSPQIINTIISAFQQKGNANNELLEIYKSIHTKMMPVHNIYEYDYKYLPPDLIHYIVSNSHTLIYAELMNNICAFGTYWLITNAHQGERFKSTVLHNGCDNYRTLLGNFLGNEHDWYKLYITKLIGSTSEIYTDNYYEENA